MGVSGVNPCRPTRQYNPSSLQDKCQLLEVKKYSKWEQRVEETRN